MKWFVELLLKKSPISLIEINISLIDLEPSLPDCNSFPEFIQKTIILNQVFH